MQYNSNMSAQDVGLTYINIHDTLWKSLNGNAVVMNVGNIWRSLFYKNGAMSSRLTFVINMEK